METVSRKFTYLLQIHDIPITGVSLSIAENFEMVVLYKTCKQLLVPENI